MTYFRTAALLAAMTALFLGIGYMLAGETGMLIALALALGMNLFAFWNSDKMVLRMYQARPATERNAPGLVGIVKQLSLQAGIPMPKVYVVVNEQPNAFATGRSPAHAAVVATTGLLKHLDYEELAGVLAHEFAHVKNRDTLVMTITATLAGAIAMLANFAIFFGGSRNNPLGIVGVLLIMILSPLAAMLVQMAISRNREYEADRMGAEICGHPLWLASALEKLGSLTRRIGNRAAEANPATAHLFIVNPLHGQKMDNLFSTHPRLEKRIERLREMAARSGQLA